MFELQPGATGVRIGDLEIESSVGNEEELVLSLPFDLFQRLRLAGQICDLLEPPGCWTWGVIWETRVATWQLPGTFSARAASPAGPSESDRQTCARETGQPTSLPRPGPSRSQITPSTWFFRWMFWSTWRKRIDPLSGRTRPSLQELDTPFGSFCRPRCGGCRGDPAKGPPSAQRFLRNIRNWVCRNWRECVDITSRKVTAWK